MIKDIFLTNSISKLSIISVFSKKYLFFTYIAKGTLSALITKFYPHVSIRFTITPSLTIQNFFFFEDKLSISLVSSVIYQYSCGQCSATYIGETRKQLKVRVSQHKGISFRTGNMLNFVGKSKNFRSLLKFWPLYF